MPCPLAGCSRIDFRHQKKWHFFENTAFLIYKYFASLKKPFTSVSKTYSGCIEQSARSHRYCKVSQYALDIFFCRISARTVARAIIARATGCSGIEFYWHQQARRMNLPIFQPDKVD